MAIPPLFVAAVQALSECTSTGWSWACAVWSRATVVLFAVGFALCGGVAGQERRGEEGESAPPYSMLRAEESYTYLRNGSPYAPDPFDAVKFIRLNSDGTAYLTLGGEVRPRLEFFDNPRWETGTEEFYSQRLSLHSALNIGTGVRVFGEVYHGLLTKSEPEFAQDDDLALHQGFVEIQTPSDWSRSVELRIGRQELAYGSARLFGIREGPNIRRSFDAARVISRGTRLTVEAFVGSEVVTEGGVFDNSRNRDMTVWGAFGRFTVPGVTGTTEGYYFGFDVGQARYDEGLASERRHTIGVRRFGRLGSSFRYNTEVMFQFGAFGDQSIRAYALETDYSYALSSLPLSPRPGVKVDYVSGDRRPMDGTLNTFNPMFENPAYFGLLAQITPMNLIDVHPSVALELGERTEAVVDWNFFWRASREDGLYSPPRFFARTGLPAQRRFIGSQPGVELVHIISRHLTWTGEASYFVSGGYLEDSGDDESVFHVATTLSFKF